MTDERLAEIEARAAAAIEGPWRCEYSEDTSHVEIRPTNETIMVDGIPMQISGWHTVVAETDQWPDEDEKSATAEFIAHARADVPALVAEIRALRQRLGGV